MIKHPALRVRKFADLLPAVMDELQADLDQFATMLPITVLEWEITGSAARGDWQFHSDLDINMRVQGTRTAARQALRDNREQTVQAMAFRRSLWKKWGVRMDISMEHPTVTTIPGKTCYCLRERKQYNPENTVRVDFDPRTGVVTPRQVRTPVRPPKVSWSWFDDDGQQHINEDPYPSDVVERWAARYGSRFLRIGDTPDTAYLKP